MADASEFKLFRTVDPTTVKVPIKEKFAKLTLSSNKKKQASQKTQSEPLARKNNNVSRQLLGELNDLDNITGAKSYEHPLLRSDSSSSNIMRHEHTPKAHEATSQLDVSDFMETLQMSGDGCTQPTQDVDVEALSTQISNMTMQREKQLPQEVSICISSTTEEAADESESCITISDTSVSDHEQNDPAPKSLVEASMAISQTLPPVGVEAVPLSSNKVQQIEAFLRDVSFQNREMVRRGYADDTVDVTRLATADTESMSPEDVDCTQLLSRATTPLLSVSHQLVDSSKRLADNDTEANTVCSEEDDSSKRLAHNDTELNTVCSDVEVPPDPSKRLANEDTEVNTPDLAEELTDQSVINESHLNETIPETCSEAEPSPARPSSASSVEPDGSADLVQTPAIQVSSINISAKINIKIHIPHMESSSPESDNGADSERSYVHSARTSEEVAAVPCQQQLEKQEQQQACEDREQPEKELSILAGDASEDEQFLTTAEKLLNQLYGKSWQTPDVIRTLKRSSGSGGKVAAASPPNRTPLTEIRRQPKARRAAATTAKKPRAPRTPALPDETALGDFSLFKRALHSNKLNSTQLPRGACTEGRANRQRPRTKHVHEERWRALVDSDSGTDASDDEDADATDCSGNEDADGQEVTYLDLTKREVEVVSNPDDDTDSPKFHRRLDDILQTCRASEKPKLPATPQTPMGANPTRRQLFTPNIGYEDTMEANRIVDQALDLDSLDQLENVYMPGSAVHTRVLEVKKQLGVAVESPKAKPVFPLQTPRRAPQAKNVETESARKTSREKFSFMKSLDPDANTANCNSEAVYYRDNYSKTREQLTERLYKIFNKEVFNNELDVPIVWSKLLRNTAGRCKNKRRGQQRSSVVELSLKVLTSANRLRCTLIHELCHAATWVFNGDGGHGAVWKRWARRANEKFPDLPRITVCHDYNIEFKYTYKCHNCETSSHSHSRSRKVENLRCRICRGPISLYLNKKDKHGNIVPTLAREATGFAKFVKDNFQKYKRDGMAFADTMRILSAQYAQLKEHGQSSDEAASQAIVNRVEILTLSD